MIWEDNHPLSARHERWENAEPGTSERPVAVWIKGRCRMMRMKKLYRKGIAAALIMTLSLGFAQPVLAESAADTAASAASAKYVTTDSTGQQSVVITGSNVNLRSGAGTSFAKVGKAKKGETFIYLKSEKGKNGKVWYQIQYSSSKTAWVISSYAKIKSNPSNQYVVITGSNVNLRTGAGTSFAKAGKAKKGEKFIYLSSEKAKGGKIWYQVQYTSSRKAWVLSTYAKCSNNDTSFSPYLTRTITIKKGSRSVYTEPDAKSRRAGKVSGGTKYTVTDWGDDGKYTWYAFRRKGKKVWISRKDVTVSDKYKSIPAKDFSAGSVPIIYLSPSKQPKNDYAAGHTNEQKEMYRVAAELQKILQGEYVCTVYTAPTDLFLSLDGRALDAYNRHADIYLAIHSNSDGSRTKKSYGAVGYYQPNNPQSKKLAENMVKEMGKIAPHKSTVSRKTVNGMKAFDGTGYSDVRDPAYYGITSILAEVEYHDNTDTAKWIVNNPKKIARALANALETTFRLQRK